MVMNSNKPNVDFMIRRNYFYNTLLDKPYWQYFLRNVTMLGHILLKTFFQLEQAYVITSNLDHKPCAIYCTYKYPPYPSNVYKSIAFNQDVIGLCILVLGLKFVSAYLCLCKKCLQLADLKKKNTLK